MLKKSYNNKVKMIYIDPLYNTGNDFVYNDKFKISKEEYDNLTDKDREIYDKKMEAISSASGQKHSKWLSMMYPRLVAAKELLTDDGVIFISIDDNEQAYLKVLCDDVFGGGNFVGTMIRKTASNRAMAKYFNCLHEYCLLYCKNINCLDIKGELKDVSNYTNLDSDPNGAWTSGNPSISGSSNNFGVENPYTHKINYPPRGRGWVFNQEKMKKLIESGQLVFKKEYRENERGFFLKQYLEGKSKYQLVNSMFFARNEFLNQVATKNDTTIFDENIFSNPKPVIFIKNLIKFSTQKDSICLDFFVGSGTTGQAVMELNNEDGGDRKFILVQLPEKISEKQPAYKFCKDNNFEPVISSITKERLRRAGAKITQQQNLLNKVDVGFKCYKIVENSTQNQFEENLFGWNEKNNDFLLSYIALMYGYGLNFTATKIETFENREFYLLSSDMVELASAVCILEKEPISDNDVLKLVQVLQKEYETKTLQFFARDRALSLETS